MFGLTPPNELANDDTSLASQILALENSVNLMP